MAGQAVFRDRNQQAGNGGGMQNTTANLIGAILGGGGGQRNQPQTFAPRPRWEEYPLDAKFSWKDRIFDLRWPSGKKEKTFEEMKKKEAMFEKSKFGTGFNQKEEDSEDSKLWRFIPINFQGDAKELVDRLNNEVYGANSEEKKVQESRELRVLKALNFGKAPTDL